MRRFFRRIEGGTCRNKKNGSEQKLWEEQETRIEIKGPKHSLQNHAKANGIRGMYSAVQSHCRCRRIDYMCLLNVVIVNGKD